MAKNRYRKLFQIIVDFWGFSTVLQKAVSLYHLALIKDLLEHSFDTGIGTKLVPEIWLT